MAQGPGPATELMLAYAYDGIQRGNPLSFFGMVYVLEGASTALALRAADGIARALGLGGSALRYLRSHGAVDQAHVPFFANLGRRSKKNARFPRIEYNPVTCSDFQEFTSTKQEPGNIA